MSGLLPPAAITLLLLREPFAAFLQQLRNVPLSSHEHKPDVCSVCVRTSENLVIVFFSISESELHLNSALLGVPCCSCTVRAHFPDLHLCP